MQKRRIKYYGSPFLRNANLIGAGNKFAPLRNADGVIQWKLSILKQTGEKPNLPTFKDKVQQLAQAHTLSGYRATKTTTRSVSRR